MSRSSWPKEQERVIDMNLLLNEQEVVQIGTKALLEGYVVIVGVCKKCLSQDHAISRLLRDYLLFTRYSSSAITNALIPPHQSLVQCTLI